MTAWGKVQLAQGDRINLLILRYFQTLRNLKMAENFSFEMFQGYVYDSVGVDMLVKRIKSAMEHLLFLSQMWSPWKCC